MPGVRLNAKKGSYDAYLIPEGVKEYSYTKGGKEVKGFRYPLKLEFPQGETNVPEKIKVAYRHRIC